MRCDRITRPLLLLFVQLITEHVTESESLKGTVAQREQLIQHLKSEARTAQQHLSQVPTVPAFITCSICRFRFFVFLFVRHDLLCQCFRFVVFFFCAVASASDVGRLPPQFRCVLSLLLTPSLLTTSVIRRAALQFKAEAEDATRKSNKLEEQVRGCV